MPVPPEMGLAHFYNLPTDVQSDTPALPVAFLPPPDSESLTTPQALYLARILPTLLTEDLFRGSLASGQDLKRGLLVREMAERTARAEGRPQSLAEMLLPAPYRGPERVQRYLDHRRTIPMSGGHLSALSLLAAMPGLQRAREAGDSAQYQEIRDNLMFQTALLSGLDMLGAADETGAAIRAMPTRVDLQGMSGIRPGLRSIFHGLLRRPLTALGSAAVLAAATGAYSPE